MDWGSMLAFKKLVKLYNQLTAQIPSQHKIKDKETVLIILKRIPQIYDERMVNLNVTTISPRCKASGQQGPTSSRSRRSWTMLATAFILTHFCLLMYLRANKVFVCLCWTTRTYCLAISNEHLMLAVLNTFPKAPFPTLRSR